MPRYIITVWQKTLSAVVVEANSKLEAEEKVNPDSPGILWDGDITTGMEHGSTEQVSEDTPLGCVY